VRLQRRLVQTSEGAAVRSRYHGDCTHLGLHPEVRVIQHPFPAFYGLAVGIAALVIAIRYSGARRDEMERFLPALWAWTEETRHYINLVSLARFGKQHRMSIPLLFAFASAPSISALIVAGMSRGPAGLGELLSRIAPWRNGVGALQGIGVYVLFFALYLGIAMGYLLLDLVVGSLKDVRLTWSILGGSPARVYRTLLIGPFIDEGGTLEELGWRGYALPLLINHFKSVWLATLVLGVLWWAWHLPREIPNIAGGVQWGAFLRGQGIFLLTMTSLSVVITQMFVLTGGSLWPGVLIHGGTNVWSKALTRLLWNRITVDLRTMIVTGFATLILLFQAFHALVTA
jgi:hypothetical protein